MSAKTPKEPIKPSSTWQCLTCPDQPIFVHAEFLAHLETVHKVARPFKGKRSMTMHLDCADSYHSTYEWEIEGKKYIQTTSNPRHP
jgi:hypothetical protein